MIMERWDAYVISGGNPSEVSTAPVGADLLLLCSLAASAGLF